MEILCFFAGVLYFFTKNLGPLCFIIIVLFFRPRLTIIAWFLAGIGWSWGHEKFVSDHHMPNQSLIQNTQLKGYVASIPIKTTDKIQFQFHIDHLNHHKVDATILLSCYQHCPNFQTGEYWFLHAKLRKPQNLSNPGGFDYVRWLNSRHMYWTGFVLQAQNSQLLLQSHRYFLLHLRQNLANNLAKIIHDERTLGIVQALALGFTMHIDKDEWDLFRKTGTIHLMVISGAHIGLISGLVYWIINWLWCRLGTACLYYPAPKLASIFALSMAFVYAILAGFGVPAQRALIVCVFMFARNFCNQRFSVWQAWRYALLAVLLFEPHSVLLSGFYLSFLAVAILIAIHRRFKLKGFRQILMMQCACLVGLMPFTLFWFSYGATNGLIANLLAIPWVGYVIVPLSLFITIAGQLCANNSLVLCVHYAINVLFTYLNWVNSFSGLNLTCPIIQITSVLAFSLTLGLLIFLPLFRLLPAMLVLVFSGLFPAYKTVKSGDVRMDVLDVGQGLAIVIQTAKHLLVYDTGVKFYKGSDMGAMVINPYLKTLNIKKIDKVVISHPDLDHRGGLKSLESEFKINELIVDNPMFYKRGYTCHAYSDWTWDGITFHFFPISSSLKSKNNTSCVLQIKNGTNKILLVGDIEKMAEHYLIEKYGDKLRSNVLVVPHHGSKTSSSIAFVNAVSPHYAVMSYGFDNRYRFPHQEVVKIYQQKQIQLLNTMDFGMVSMTLARNQLILSAYYKQHESRTCKICQ